MKKYHYLSKVYSEQDLKKQKSITVLNILFFSSKKKINLVI